MHTLIKRYVNVQTAELCWVYKPWSWQHGLDKRDTKSANESSVLHPSDPLKFLLPLGSAVCPRDETRMKVQGWRHSLQQPLCIHRGMGESMGKAVEWQKDSWTLKNPRKRK